MKKKVKGSGATQEIPEDHDLLRTLMDHLPDCHVFIKDKNSRFVTTNAFHLKSLGVKSLKDVVGKTDFDFFPKELAQQYYDDEQKVIRSGKALVNRDERMIDSRGRERWLLTTKTPLHDAKGRITGFVGISRDITERKMAEEALARHGDQLEKLVEQRTAKLRQMNDQLHAEALERKRAEQQLHVEHDRLRAIMDNLPRCHIFIKDRESRFIATNASHLRALGRKTLAEVVGKTDFDMFPREYAERYFGDEQELMRTGKPLLNREEPFIDHDGTTGWLVTNKVPIRGPDGEVTGLVGMSLDITERQKVESQLVEERNLLRTLIDNLPFWIYVKDRESRFVLGNRTLADRFLGSSDPYLIVGKSDLDLFPTAEARDYYDEEQRLLKTGVPVLRKLETFVDKMGNSSLLEVTKIPLRDAQGDIVGIVGFNNDITERRKAENQLVEERNLLRTLIDNLPHAVYVKDTQGRFIIGNKAVARIMKVRSVDELVGKTDFDFYPEGSAKEFLHDEQLVITTGQPVINKSEPVKDEKGETIWILTTKLPIRDQAGKVLGVVGIGFDDTKRKEEETKRRQLEEQLRQSEKMKAIGHLAGGVAHDFNNQLMAIMGSADMIKTWPDDGGVPQHAEMILAASRRAADLTGKLLAFARKGQYQSVPVNVHKLIVEVVSLLERSIDKRIRIIQKLRATSVLVKGDPTQLQNALLNLAINARDAMLQEGEIVFSTETVVLDERDCRQHPHEIVPGRYVQISITDTGAGMDEETKKRIFEPFFTTKKEGEGTGMGLAAVYGTVRNHRGTIDFTSELGYGTKFRILLPLAADEQEQEEAQFHGTPVSGVARILVVDDEELVRATMTAILQKLGYTVTLCGDGDEAVQYYRESWRNVDLVIMDMIMPHMGGLDAFRAMKQVHPEIKALLATGYSIAGEAQDIMNEGVRGFIQKPFQVAVLSRAVAEALAQ